MASTESDTQFLTRPRPPSFTDLKITLLAAAILVILSIGIDLIRLLFAP